MFARERTLLDSWISDLRRPTHLTSDDISVQIKPLAEVCFVKEASAHFGKQDGGIDGVFYTYTSEMKMSPAIVLAMKFEDVTIGRVWGGDVARRKIDEVDALVRAVLGRNATFSLLLDGEVSYNGEHKQLSEPWLVPSGKFGPALFKFELDVCEEMIRALDKNDIRSRKLARALEVLHQAHRAREFGISLLYRWLITEIYSGGRDVKPPLARLYKTNSRGLFSFGIHHFEAIRNGIVHDGYYFKPNDVELVDVALNRLAVDLLRDMTKLTPQNWYPRFARDNLALVEILRPHAHACDPNFPKKERSLG